MKPTKIPLHFALCMQSSCPKAPTCTRQILFANIPEDIPQFTLINPHHHPSTDQGCPQFHLYRTVLNAYGFTRLYSQLPQASAEKFWATIPSIKSERTYYRMKSGQHPIPPLTQQQILDSAHRLGAPSDIAFDRYEEEVEW